MAGRRLHVPHRVHTKPPERDRAMATVLGLATLGAASTVAAAGAAAGGSGWPVPAVIAVLCLLAAAALVVAVYRSHLRHVTFDHGDVVLQRLFRAERIPAVDIVAIQFHAAERPPPDDPHLHHGLLIEIRDGTSHLLCEPDFVDDLDSLIPDLIEHYRLPDTYERSRTPVPHHLFGPGSDRPFAEYFTGSTTTSMTSVEEVIDWLAACEFVHDVDRFGRHDHWQHPLEFERNRFGDCEDHALWAWRRLVELGYEAEFVCGHRKRHHAGGWDVHAWVTFEAEGTAYLLETASKQPVLSLVPLADIGLRYVPHYSVDGRFETTHYPANILGDDRYHRVRHRR
ncbi:MAG: transglutaminase domain-containing protein [Actinomycetota bacterium]